MNGKQLSIVGQQLSPRQSIAKIENNAEPVDMLDRFVEKLLKSGKGSDGTVDEIIHHTQVKKHGFLGRLSSSQQNLVTSVVSIMQDRVSGEAKHNADALKQIILLEREALLSMSTSFSQVAKNLYSLPLLTTVKAQAEESEVHAEHAFDNNSYTANASLFFSRLLNWGNLIALSAVILAVLVVKTSVETANYETQYHLTKQNLLTLEIKYENMAVINQTLMAENRISSEENAVLNSKLGEAEKQQILAKKRHDETMNKQENIARRSGSINSSVRASLTKEIAALQQELALFKGKESQLDENYRVWKELAEDRKVEIGRLQSDLLSMASNSAVSASKPRTKFLGLF